MFLVKLLWVTILFITVIEVSFMMYTNDGSVTSAYGFFLGQSYKISSCTIRSSTSGITHRDIGLDLVRANLLFSGRFASAGFRRYR